MSVRSRLGTGARFVAAFVIVAIVTPVTAAGVLLATNLFVPLPATLPEPTELEAIQFSEVYGADGQLIHVFRQFDQNIPVAKGDIPEVVEQAVIAAEDRNFYAHEGFDIRGTVRALVTDVRQGELAEGGSTITQQLARNAYGVGTERSIQRKIREAILASQLDRSMSKDDILHEYLSVVYFGEGAYGIGAAAEVYFQKPVAELTLSEAATVAGIIPAPSRFNPRADAGTAEIRRKSVLGAMLDEEMITRAEYDEALLQVVWPEWLGPPPGPATIVRNPPVDTTRYPYFIQYLRQYLVDALGSEDLLYRGGLRIYTTLDPRVQAEAEATVAEAVDGVPAVTTLDANGAEVTHDLQMSITAVEPPTGFVRALVGGRDFALDQTNMSTGAGTFRGRGRQPGSSFKPFVLATAFEQGITPDAVYSGGPYQKGEYAPSNYGGAVYGNLTLRTATEKSVNTAFVRLMEEVDPYAAVDTAQRLGIDTPEIDPAVDGSGLAISLGSRETTTLEMASAYGTFANRGSRVAPTPVIRVFDADGELVLDRSQPEGEQVLQQATADNVTDVLRGVLTRGTAAGRGIDRPAAGKTGTAQDNRDGWFVGYTPTLSTAVWMGFDPPPPDPVDRGRFTVRGSYLTGGSFPARAWQRFMRPALQGVPVTDFSEPAPIRSPESEDVQRERQGFSPGAVLPISGTDSGGPYTVPVEPPSAPAPTTTTTSTSTTTTTTSTTTTTRPCQGPFCDDD